MRGFPLQPFKATTSLRGSNSITFEKSGRAPTASRGHICLALIGLSFYYEVRHPFIDAPFTLGLGIVS